MFTRGYGENSMICLVYSFSYFTGDYYYSIYRYMRYVVQAVVSGRRRRHRGIPQQAAADIPAWAGKTHPNYRDRSPAVLSRRRAPPSTIEDQICFGDSTTQASTLTTLTIYVQWACVH